MTTVDVTCPTCGTVSYFEELGRDAGAFCRVCDYPLFWVRSVRLAGDDSRLGDTGLRRLPGTAGRVAVATLDCPTCTEPNPVTAVICIRCGELMNPEPATERVIVVPPPPPPPPVLEPEPVAKRRIWPWVLLIVAFLAGLGLLIGLLVAY